MALREYRYAMHPVAILALCVSFVAVTAVPAVAQTEGGSMGGQLPGAAPSAAPRPRYRAPKPQPEAAPPPRVVRVAPAPRAPRAPRSGGGGGGGGNYDGAWAISAGGSCAAAGSNQITISGGRVIGQGIAGSVSAGGAVSTQGNLNGLIVYGSGTISGRSASGTYRQSDGCSGPWNGYRL